MTDLRIIAVVADEADLVAVCRTRAETLDRSREAIDVLCRWKSGQASKYLCNPPLRGLALESLFTLAPALGMALLLIEHEPSMQQIAKRTRKRQLKAVRANGLASMFNRRSASRIIRHFGHIGGIARAQQTEGENTLIKIASKGGKARKKALSRQARKQIASDAAIIRWEKVRAAVQTPK